MDLTRNEQEAIAALTHNPGYMRLLELLAASEQATLAEAENEADPAKLLRTMRFWQFLHKVNGWLASTPATIDAELTRLREDGQLDPDLPTSRDHAWNMRFRRPDPVDEDDTYDPASI